MKNINEVREALSQVFEGLKSGAIEPKIATELNNSAGKIIKSLATEIAYYQLRNEKPIIKYFGEIDIDA